MALPAENDWLLLAFRAMLSPAAPPACRRTSCTADSVWSAALAAMLPPEAWNTTSPPVLRVWKLWFPAVVSVAWPSTSTLPLATKFWELLLLSTTLDVLPSRVRLPVVVKERLSAAIELAPLPITRRLPWFKVAEKLERGVVDTTLPMSSATPLRARLKDCVGAVTMVGPA